MFPSPYGLIFILTKKATWGEITEELQVSVSLRSYIHSYLQEKIINLQYMM